MGYENRTNSHSFLRLAGLSGNRPKVGFDRLISCLGKVGRYLNHDATLLDTDQKSQQIKPLVHRYNPRSCAENLLNNSPVDFPTHLPSLQPHFCLLAVRKPDFQVPTSGGASPGVPNFKNTTPPLASCNLHPHHPHHN